jgi:hypothetical protein
MWIRGSGGLHITECFMFSGTRQEARVKFNEWAKDKALKDMQIHEQLYRNRDSVAELGVMIIVYYNPEVP